MDADKRRKLIEVDYAIHPCCGLCEHADVPAMSDWGTCKAHDYQHEKHTGERRQLSINRLGWCPTFREADIRFLGAFAEFVRDSFTE
jgi:hypothetical protein